jgi:hypothetical protein
VKMSIVSNTSGKIVAASFTTYDPVQTVGRKVTDQIKIPDGHRMHHVTLPVELADEILSGNFAKAFSRYTLEVKGKKAVLKPQVSKK